MQIKGVFLRRIQLLLIILFIHSVLFQLMPVRGINSRGIVSKHLRSDWSDYLLADDEIAYGSSPQALLFGDENSSIDQNQSENSGYAVSFSNDEKCFAQRFRPEYEIFTSLCLLLALEGDLSDQVRFFVSIRRHLQIEEEIYEIDCTRITENPSWISCDIPFHTMDVNESYYILCFCHGLTEDQQNNGSIEWFYGVDDPYQRGEPFFVDETGDWDPFYGVEPMVDFCFRTYGYGNDNPDPPQCPKGPTEGYYGRKYSYETVTHDADQNNVFYQWSWGDGSRSEWLGPFESGEQCKASHVWQIKGSYIVKVKAKDIWGYESDWSDLLTIQMEKRKIFSFFSFDLTLFL